MARIKRSNQYVVQKKGKGYVVVDTNAEDKSSRGSVVIASYREATSVCLRYNKYVAEFDYDMENGDD